jgi:hypothetical protein
MVLRPIQLIVDNAQDQVFVITHNLMIIEVTVIIVIVITVTIVIIIIHVVVMITIVDATVLNVQTVMVRLIAVEDSLTTVVTVIQIPLVRQTIYAPRMDRYQLLSLSQKIQLHHQIPLRGQQQK